MIRSLYPEADQDIQAGVPGTQGAVLVATRPPGNLLY